MTSRTASERVLIRASAGTGKTFQLSNHFLRHFLNGSAPDEILATTFTRKAAGEIQSRVFERLVEATRSRTYSEILQKFLDPSSRYGLSLTQERCRDALHQLARNIHRLRISTLDSFYAKLATAYALELALPADWRVLDDIEVVPLKLASIDDLLSAARPDDTVALMHLLDKGDTKSRVVTQILNAVSSFYEVYRDVERRFEPWDAVPELPKLSTTEIDQAVSVIADFGPGFPHKSGAKAMLSLIDSARAQDWKAVATATVVTKVLSGEEKFYGKEIADELAVALQRLGRHAAAIMLEELKTQTAATYRLLDTFDTHFQSRKRDAGGLTFNDVTRQIAGATQATAANDVTFRLDGEFTHLLLDEFQDTSLPQWNVLKPIAEKTLARSGSSVFCVGDVKQAIYGWRGGVAAIFDRVAEELSIDPHSMDTSYRSSPDIIDAVNKIFGRLPEYGRFSEPDGRAVIDWHARYEKHHASSDEPGYVEVRVTPDPDRRLSKFGADVRRWTAHCVATLAEAHPTRTIGVLTRKNSVASEIVAHLRGLGLEASDEGREKLTDSAAVQLLYSLFTIAEHPGDTAARYHVVTSPLTLPSNLKSHTDDAAAGELSLRLRAALIDDGYANTVQHWARYLTPQCGPRDVARLQQLVQLAELLDRTSSPQPAEFLRLVDETYGSDPTAARIRVMTVHQSKGLEFDLVVLCELDEPVYRLERSGYVAARPSPAEPPDRIMRYRGQQERLGFPAAVRDVFDEAAAAEMAEGLCRFYVAVTRARSSLHFLVAPSGSERGVSGTTPAAIVRALLCEGRPLEANTVAATFGSADWDRSPDVAASGSNDRGQVELKLHVRSTMSRDLPTISPSGLATAADSAAERLEKEPAEQTAPEDTPSSKHGGSAAARGTLVHRWLEEITWIDSSDPLPVTRRMELANSLDIAPSIAENASAYFDRVLSQPTLRAILDAQQYEAAAQSRVLTVRNEARFAVGAPDTSQLLVGTVDRLVLFGDDHPNGAEIIDWKTDLIVDEAAFAAKVANYRPQLWAYADAVADLFKLPRSSVRARLVFLSIDREVTVDVSEPTPVQTV